MPCSLPLPLASPGLAQDPPALITAPQAVLGALLGAPQYHQDRHHLESQLSLSDHTMSSSMAESLLSLLCLCPVGHTEPRIEQIFNKWL